MKAHRSIRWRLQLWHSLLLAAVLVGFVATAHRLRRTELLRAADEDLERRLTPLVTRLQPPGPPNGPNGRGGRGGPGERGGGPDGPGGPNGRGERGPGANFTPPTGNGPQPPAGRGVPSAPTPILDELMANPPEDRFYFIVWNREGGELGRFGEVPALVSPPDRDHPAPEPRLRGTAREAWQFLPAGDVVLVGRDLAPELADLTRFGWLLSGVGLGVFVCGLAGGWWLTGRALRPLAAIGTTAGRIAHGDLTQRISTADTDSELGALAGVLNETFDRLEASFARQARFTADASHELRTPLAVLLSQTQAVLARPRTPEEYRDCLAACERAAQRMRRLVESLLTLARLDAGDPTARREPCDLAALAADTIELLRPIAVEKGITLKLALAPAPCQGDPDRLAQVATNLIANAIHHHLPGGVVTVASGPREGSVALTITDTGPGIAAADLPHIFERFYRADQSRAGSAGRTGLGLAITQAIVEAHGGTLTVSSEPGRGSTFTATFPAAG